MKTGATGTPNTGAAMGATGPNGTTTATPTRDPPASAAAPRLKPRSRAATLTDLALISPPPLVA
jgi:hypothetical protein